MHSKRRGINSRSRQTVIWKQTPNSRWAGAQTKKSTYLCFSSLAAMPAVAHIARGNARYTRHTYKSMTQRACAPQTTIATTKVRWRRLARLKQQLSFCACFAQWTPPTPLWTMSTSGGKQLVPHSLLKFESIVGCLHTHTYRQLLRVLPSILTLLCMGGNSSTRAHTHTHTSHMCGTMIPAADKSRCSHTNESAQLTLRPSLTQTLSVDALCAPHTSLQLAVDLCRLLQ